MPTKTESWTKGNAKPRFAAFAIEPNCVILGCRNFVRTSTPTGMVSLTQQNVARSVNICTNTEAAKAIPEPDHEDHVAHVAHEEEIQIGRPIVDLAHKP